MGSRPNGYPQRNYDQEAMNGVNPANYLSDRSRPAGVPRAPGKVGFTAQQEAMLARMKSLDCRAGQRPYVPGTVPEGYPVTAPTPRTFDKSPFQLEHSANFTQSQQQRSNLEELQKLQLQQQYQMKQQQFTQQVNHNGNSNSTSAQAQNHFAQIQQQQQQQLQNQIRSENRQQEEFRLQQQHQLNIQAKYNQLGIMPYAPVSAGQTQTRPVAQHIPIHAYPQHNSHAQQSPYVQHNGHAPQHAHVPNAPAPTRVSAARLVHGAPL